MELNTPSDALCPLCEAERVELKENKAGRPYFHCTTHKVPVNLNAGETSEEFAQGYVEQLEEAELDHDADEGDGPTIEDLFNQGDDA